MTDYKSGVKWAIKNQFDAKLATACHSVDIVANNSITLDHIVGHTSVNNVLNNNTWDCLKAIKFQLSDFSTI